MPSSLKTTQFGPSWNFAVVGAAPFTATEAPMPTASDEPKLSVMAIWGMCSSRPFLFSWLHMTPEEPIWPTLERSQRPGFASSASRIGPAKAWPTITIVFTFSRSTMSSNSAALNDRFGLVTMQPAVASAMNEENRPVPCMSGQATYARRHGHSGLTRSISACTDSPGATPYRAFAPKPSTANRSSWRHITPFGMPVVPPVYRNNMSSPDRSATGTTGAFFAATTEL